MLFSIHCSLMSPAVLPHISPNSPTSNNWFGYFCCACRIDVGSVEQDVPEDPPMLLQKFIRVCESAQHAWNVPALVGYSARYQCAELITLGSLQGVNLV